ncbi:MAG: cytochrome c-type biogenesis protein [Pseudomonadota bacterium]
MIKILNFFLFSLSLLAFSPSFAAVDIYQFDTESQRMRYHALMEELRCPKCQNQNLSGSDSHIAADLRRELHRLLLAGNTDREIKDFMVARYGDFVLYKPPLSAATMMLWGLPILLLVFAAVAFAIIVGKRRQSIEAAGLSDQDQRRLKEIINLSDQ